MMTGMNFLFDYIRPKLGRILLLWVVLSVVALAMMAGIERHRLVGDFTNKSANLHRLTSQRADQHDAHLTSLSAIFVAGGIARQDLLLNVAATITRFYPRITSVNVIPFDGTEPIVQTSSDMSGEEVALVRRLAMQSTGTLQIGLALSKPNHYLLVKRTPNTDAAKNGLALIIDAQAMMASDDPFWQKPSVAYSLFMPDGTPLAGELISGGVEFSKQLGSASQPLIFKASLVIQLADLLSVGTALPTLAVLSALFLIILLGFAQRAHTTDAENRAKLSAQEARLAHASRINAMGEMASGMAHELSQPLTAILSQSQAGRRLAQRGDIDRLGDILDDTVAQAQRASDILERLRRWSKPNRAHVRVCSLNDAVRGVDRLLALEAKETGATVILEVSEAPILIHANPVELEQVIFNLVRNAFEASDGAHVTIRTSTSNEVATLEIIDDGPGVPSHLRPRIFEPFVTGKPDGTGLGLALCQRLVEEMDGEIALIEDAPLTVFQITLPLSKAPGNHE